MMLEQHTDRLGKKSNEESEIVLLLCSFNKILVECFPSGNGQYFPLSIKENVSLL